MQTSSVPTIFELVDGYRGQVINLDERNAVKNFLGKTADEAYEMFCSDSNHIYAEDLMWMSVGGLEYYLSPALCYIQGDRSNGDCTFASGLLCALWTQVENRELPPQLILIIRSVVEYIRSNLSKFVVEEWDGHYLPHMQQQISRIERLLK